MMAETGGREKEQNLKIPLIPGFSLGRGGKDSRFQASLLTVSSLTGSQKVSRDSAPSTTLLGNQKFLADQKLSHTTNPDLGRKPVYMKSK